MKKIEKAFRPRARLLALLGEQLIDNARLAVFELVKNAYDADANKVVVTLDNPKRIDGKITVQDDGSGMPLHILTDVWLEPGADLREQQKLALIRTPRFRRLPLGEKGVGRFAAHKLGNKIEVWTRAADDPEYHVKIDWSEQVNKRYMDETLITIRESPGKAFKSGQSGTKIEITELRSLWSRGDVRRLWRNVTSISGPFVTTDDFDVTLSAPDNNVWLRGLLDVSDILGSALWVFDFDFFDGKFKWNYRFRPPRGMGLKGREGNSKNEGLPFPKKLAVDLLDTKKPPKIVPAEFSKGVGPVNGSFFVFDQDREVVAFLKESVQINDFLEENGGVRVYRDDIRVYSYGEPGDDWLGLDLRRVNQPTKAISNNNIVGIINLNMEDSKGLREKTSRDGFDQNEEFHHLRAIVLSALSFLEGQRTVDKSRMRQVLAKTGRESKISPNAALTELRAEMKKRKTEPAIVKLVDKVEQRVKQMQDTFLRPGATQMHVATLFHEVEHGVRALYAAIQRGEKLELLEKRSHSLIELLDSFSNFFRKTPAADLLMSDVVKMVLQLNADRFERHEIVLSFPLGTKEVGDFRIRAPQNIVMGAISNLLDNSIYWLDQKWPDGMRPRKRAIRITVSDLYSEGPALIVADNGPGYQLAPEDVLQPFITLKPDGMGIGMYYNRLVMEACNGFVAFPSADDVGLPKSYSGAITALVFGDGVWQP
ncbi:MAG TPA: ATP-binding protein [Verrucomicrobiae bacterium]|nr:ATP-binding protein [Verrucomicrobiae bacterium]